MEIAIVLTMHGQGQDISNKLMRWDGADDTSSPFQFEDFITVFACCADYMNYLASHFAGFGL